MITDLLGDLNQVRDASLEVILTANIPEDSDRWDDNDFATKIIRNASPKGFGANHNAAFRQACGRHFAVVNPDIRMPNPCFAQLFELFDDQSIGAVAPLVRSSDGTLQDNARRFPTVSSLARKLASKNLAPDYNHTDQPITVDWVAGMFAVYRREAFMQAGGFDERYFLYYEDVDICRRLRRQDWRIVLNPGATVIHDAQRASHRNWRHLRWHVASALRYLLLSGT
jgi:GT2 family glycosyltransferase